MWLLLTRSLLGTWPSIQACALTANRTRNPMFCRSAPNPLSHISQGWFIFTQSVLFLVGCSSNKIFLLLYIQFFPPKRMYMVLRLLSQVDSYFLYLINGFKSCHILFYFIFQPWFFSFLQIILQYFYFFPVGWQ